jgi:hypothetical protein
MSNLVITPNILLTSNLDKVGLALITLKNALVATGLWRVVGSGDGQSAFQLLGQTAGVGGSYDVFTAGTPYASGGTNWHQGPANGISRAAAWFILEEITSGRVFACQRTTQSQSNTASAVAFAIGLARPTSGASATVIPALPGTSAFLLGTAWNTTQGAWPATEGSTATDTAQWWMQLAITDSLAAGNVAPFYLAIWSKTSNVPVCAIMWESLASVDTGVSHPVVAAAGSWPQVFGTPGNASSGGAFAGTWRGGDTLAAAAYEYPNNGGIGTIPANYQAVNNAGIYRTHQPWVLIPGVSSKHLGKLEHFYLNKVNRQYPTTYGVAGTTPRVTLGLLIGTWKTATTPETSP